MLYGNYRFFCTLQEPAQLQTFKGSTFRGAFGHALKKVVCAARRRDCDECILMERCLYAKTFELIRSKQAALSRIAAPPHPYVLEPPTTQQDEFAQGESLDIGLLLFGDINDYLPYFIYAFEVMGENGIGKRGETGRARFSVQEVLANGESIYDPAEGKLKSEVSPEVLWLWPKPAAGTGEVGIRFETPLRLKFANTFQKELPFDVFVRALLRRVSSLFEAHGQGEPDLDYKGLVYRAKEVETLEDQLRWHDIVRYSNRQKRHMNIGGLLGKIEYSGDLEEYLPLIDVCRKLHIGKQTSFGLGKYEAEFRAESS